MKLEAGDEYTCAVCGGTFVTDWSMEEAQAEASELFTEDELAGPQALVCDDCWEAVKPTPEKVARWREDR